MGIADTAPEVRRRQLEAYRAMTPQRRVEIALAMSEEAQRVTMDGIRSRTRSLDEQGVRQELLRILHGDRLARGVSGPHQHR